MSSEKKIVTESRLKRDSNYELMRISSMFMIILWHILQHGHVETNATGLVSAIAFLLKAIVVVHVNSYVLVTGYYQCKTKFKLKKLISLNNASWFYRVFFMILFLGIGYIEVGKVEFLQMIFPIDFSAYWFVKTYLLLYCFSPFLNILIEHLSKKKFQILLCVSFMIFSVLPTISMQMIYYNAGGFSLTTFVLLYLLGAYYRNYPIEKSRIFSVNTRRKNQLIFFLLFIVFFIVNYLFFHLGTSMLGTGEITSYLGNTILLSNFSYDNPLVVIGALMYFFWFGTIHIKSKWINKISSLTLGIYLIHENPYIKGYLYSKLGFTTDKIYTGLKIFIKIFACAILIFIVCAIIEWIRQWIFKKGNQTRIVKWFQRKTHEYFSSLSHTKEVEQEL